MSTKMGNQTIIEGLKRLARPDGKAISDVAVFGKCAYATDGRIGISVELPEPHGDSVPGNYPLNSLIEIINEAKPYTDWKYLDVGEFKTLDGKFKSQIDNMRERKRVEHECRYHETVCPCCGDTVYWDMDNEEIVEEKEACPEIGERDIDLPVRIRFVPSDNIFTIKGSVVVNFLYPHILGGIFGDHYIRYAIGKNRMDNDIVCFESAGGIVRGVLMPMRPLVEDVVVDVELKVEDGGEAWSR